MKKQQADQKKRKEFIKMPAYPGGKDEMNKFISENLIYPKEAAEKRIEGYVMVSFDVDHNGTVSEKKVVRGIGFGCDEEALRIISLLRFGNTHNRGLRVRKTMRLKIFFRLTPSLTISYSEKGKNNQDGNEETEKKKPEVYSYTISL